MPGDLPSSTLFKAGESLVLVVKGSEIYSFCHSHKASLFNVKYAGALKLVYGTFYIYLTADDGN